MAECAWMVSPNRTTVNQLNNASVFLGIVLVMFFAPCGRTVGSFWGIKNDRSKASTTASKHILYLYS